MSKLPGIFVILLSLVQIMVSARLSIADAQIRDIIPSQEEGTSLATVNGQGLENTSTAAVTSNLWVTAYYDVWLMVPLGANWWAEPPDRLDYSNGITHIIQFADGNIRTNSPFFGPVAGVDLNDSLDMAYGVGRPGSPTYYRDTLIAMAHRNNVRVLLGINAVCATNLLAVLDQNGSGTIDGADSARCDVLTGSVAAYLARHRYDGVDINIERGCGVFPSQSHIGMLLRRMRHYLNLYTAGNGGRMLITLSPTSGDQGNYPVADCNANVDQINPQTYDNQYAWSGCLGANVNWFADALYPPSTAQLGSSASCFGAGNLVHSISQHGPSLWFAAGYNKSILGVGISTYGRLRSPGTTPYQAFNVDGYAANQPAIVSGLLANGGTLMPYDSITKSQAISGTALHSASYNGTTASVNAGQGFYYTYPTPRSVQDDIAWIKANGYSGMMLFDYQMDSDPANADITKRNPIINAAAKAAGGTIVLPPSAPLNQAPVNSATAQQKTGLQFVWSAPAGALSYHYQISTSSSFATLITEFDVATNSVVVGQTPFAGSLAGSTSYYWRVNATGAGGTSAYSSTSSFATVADIVLGPGAPVLVAPANGLNSQATSFTFLWRRSTGSTSYRFQLSTDSLFSTRSVDDSLLVDTTRSVTALPKAVNYYWRANAKNAAGVSLWSLVRRFSTLDNVPPTVSITSPSPTATVSNTVTVSASALDNFGLIGVQFRLDGNPLGVEDTTAPYSIAWDASSASAGIHVLMAVARDAASNSTTSVPVTVTVVRTGDLWVYQESLMPSWINASWGGTYTLNSTEQHYSLPNSIKCATGSWGALRLRSSNWGTTLNINSTAYSNLEFHIFNRSQGFRLNLYLANESGGTFPVVSFNSIAVDQWVTISSAMAVLNPGNLPVQYIVMQTNTSSASTFYVDDLRLVASTPAPANEPVPFSAEQTPSTFALAEGFPNPFNPTTTISVDLPEEAVASVKVYDILGREVATLLSGQIAAGKYQTSWNPGNLAGGAYFVRFEAVGVGSSNRFTKIRKVLFVK